MISYDIYKVNRNSNNIIHNKGDGVLIAVHKRFLSRLLPPYELNSDLSWLLLMAST